MRARTAASLTVLTGLAAATLSVTPASAATYQLTLSVTGRDGLPATTKATVLNLTLHHSVQMSAGQTRSLPAGKYAIGGWIGSIELPDPTLAAETFTLSKSRTLVLDVRAGKPVGVHVDDPDAHLTALQVIPFSADGTLIQDPLGMGPTFTHPVYVIPSPDSTRIRLGAHAVLSDVNGVRYDLVKSYRGVPRTVSLSGTRNTLARVDMSFSSLEDTTSRSVRLRPSDPDTNEPIADRTGLTDTTLIGTRLTSYRTEGPQWTTVVLLRTKSGTAQLTQEGTRRNNRAYLYAAGTTYTERWGAGIWTAHAPRVETDGRRLSVAGRGLICAPTGNGVTLDHCSLSGVKVTYRVLSGSKVLASGPSSISVVIPKAAHWYTIEATAERASGAATSTRISGRWRVRASGADDVARPAETGGFSVQATGLDELHRGPAGGHTTIDVHPTGLDKVKTLTVEYSTDDGGTWHKSASKHSGAHWTAGIVNPAVGGAVSIRVTATSTSGATAQQTIVRAWLTH